MPQHMRVIKKGPADRALSPTPDLSDGRRFGWRQHHVRVSLPGWGQTRWKLPHPACSDVILNDAIMILLTHFQQFLTFLARTLVYLASYTPRYHPCKRAMSMEGSEGRQSIYLIIRWYKKESEMFMTERCEGESEKQESEVDREARKGEREEDNARQTEREREAILKEREEERIHFQKCTVNFWIATSRL